MPSFINRSHKRASRRRPPFGALQKTNSNDTSSGSTALESLILDIDDATEVVDLCSYDLDEPISIVFHDGDPVWVRTDDEEWTQGIVSGKSTRRGPTRQREGTFFPVSYGANSRRYFAPLNGDIKPDTQNVRQLLLEGGWL